VASELDLVAAALVAMDGVLVATAKWGSFHGTHT
jgi:hypothetical protein